jgi:hypothetical protein
VLQAGVLELTTRKLKSETLSFRTSALSRNERKGNIDMKLPIQSASFTSQPPLYAGVQMSGEGASRGVTPSACVSARVQRGRACLRLPVRLPFIGREVCLPAPGVPNLGQVSGCCNVRRRFGVPTGVRCCLRYQGREIICRSFP